MDKPPQKFAVGSRVRLRDGVHPAFYEGFGLPGNEGWIRKHRRESYGYNRIFIEWDKNSWSYNGAEDNWTWEDHFELVEDQVMSKKEQDFNVEDVIRELAKRMGMVDGAPDPEGPTEEQLLGPDLADEDDAVVDYDATLEEAFEDAAQAQAFVVLTLNEETFEEAPGNFIFPTAYHAARDKKSSLICKMQLGDLAQQFQEVLVKKELERDDEG